MIKSVCVCDHCGAAITGKGMLLVPFSKVLLKDEPEYVNDGESQQLCEKCRKNVEVKKIRGDQQDMRIANAHAWKTYIKLMNVLNGGCEINSSDGRGDTLCDDLERCYSILCEYFHVEE